MFKRLERPTRCPTRKTLPPTPVIPETHMVKVRIDSFNLRSKHTHTVACMHVHTYIHTKR